MPRAHATLLLAAALSLSGCTAAMELGRARTLEPGEWDVGAAVGFSGYGGEERVPQEDATGGLVILLPVPPVELWAGRGVAPGLELDARVSLLSAQLGVKAQALRSQWLDLSLAATAVADVLARPDREPATRGRLAFLAGVPLGRFELDVAPQCTWALDPARRRPELWGATGQLHYGPLPGGMRRIGIAVSVLRYSAPSPGPGDVSAGTYVGGALVFSARGAPATALEPVAP
jgi:hypothetical protein